MWSNRIFYNNTSTQHGSVMFSVDSYAERQRRYNEKNYDETKHTISQRKNTKSRNKEGKEMKTRRKR